MTSLEMNHYPIYLSPLLVCASVSSHLAVSIKTYPHSVHSPDWHDTALLLNKHSHCYQVWQDIFVSHRSSGCNLEADIGLLRYKDHDLRSKQTLAVGGYTE